MKIPKTIVIVRLFLCAALCAICCYAGPLVTAAQGVNTEIIQAAAAIVGAILVVGTVSMMGSGGARMFALLLEIGAAIYIILNPNSITQFFRFGG